MPPQQQQQGEGDNSGRPGPNPLVCEMFQGINTATTRAGVPDQQMAWCDGFIPLAPRNLRVLPGIGPPLYTAPSGVTISCFYFYNLGSMPFACVFNSDGSIVQVRTTDGATTTILGAASGIVSPSPTTVGVAQYGSQYLIIVAAPPAAIGNGYVVWDGTQLYFAGSLAPQITLTNPGTAYVSSPSVVVSGGSGSGATASANVANGSVTNVKITNAGSNYKPQDVVKVTFVGGQQTGSGASLTAVLSSIPGGTGATVTVNWTLLNNFGNSSLYAVSSVTINTPGSGYSTHVVGSWNNPSPRGPNDNFWNTPNSGSSPPTITVSETGGAVNSVTTQNLGSGFGWTTLNSSPQFPTITISDPTSSQFQVTSVTGTPTGTNYSPSTIITASGGGSPVTQATITPIITSGVITGVNILSGGIYGSNTPPTLAVTDVAVVATATVGLMPFGIQGNSVETYAGHVWVAKGPVVELSAPGSVSDFASSDGGGTFTSSDSFLRVGYTKLIQTNGFLFLIGDSSMNYISGVQTNTPAMGNPTTTYTNNNSDPETGTPYPASVVTIGQDIFIANQNGVYVSTGGTFEKKSEALDGIYNSAPGIFNGQQLSAAKALIHGKLVWMVLVPIIDPITNLQRNKMFMFNQKFWWSTEQDVPLTFIQAQEFNSVFQAYGTDGKTIYPLFVNPSAAFTKRMQTRLWDAPAGYDFTKSSVRLFVLAQFMGTQSLSYQIQIDNEQPSSNEAGPYIGTPTAAVWTNASGVVVSWGVPWYLTGSNIVSVLPPTAIGQMGVLTGMTLTTNCDDMVLISEMMQDQVVQYRG